MKPRPRRTTLLILGAALAVGACSTADSSGPTAAATTPTPSALAAEAGENRPAGERDEPDGQLATTVLAVDGMT